MIRHSPNPQIHATTRPMKYLVSKGIVGGAIGALLVGMAETLIGNGSDPGKSLVVAIGLLLPIGIATGIGLICLRGILPPDSRPTHWKNTLLSKDAPVASASIYIVGILLLLAMALFYRTIFFFLTGFRHHGLAAMALSISMGFLATFLILGSKRAIGPTGGLLKKAAVQFKPLGSPAVALGLVLILWLGAIIPPLAIGPEATGPFGFIGFLMKDGLKAGPLLSLLGIGAVALVFLWFTLDRKIPFVFPVAIACTTLGIVGPFGASFTASASPQTLDRLESTEALSSLCGKLARKLGDGDKDGHARWMGGKDCDDKNDSIYPGARDIPDNGIDEDCSGKDLVLSELLAAANESEDALEKLKKELALPDLPDDVSIFMITIDAWRWNAAGFMGYDRPITPNLDQLLENATIYDRAYALGSYTGQAVPPLMTGKYASEMLRNDRHELRLSGKEKTIAEYICNENVKCSAVLSHFLFEPHFGWNQGFQEWKVAGASPSGPGHIDSKYNSHSVANQTIKWLKKPENTSGRFFLWTHYMDPHKEYLEHKGFKKFGTDRRSRYDQEILFTDYHIGRVLKYFMTLPAAKNTIFIVSADHGEAFNEHGRWCHGKELWEEIIRIPLAIAGPGIPKKRIARQTSLIDFFPTMLDIFGIEIPKGLHGRSLLADWVEGQELPETPIISDQPQNPNYETRRVFIKDGWKLHDLPDTGTYRLYQITDDYERGKSLVESNPEDFKKIKGAYDLWSATKLKPVPPVKYSAGNVNNMPLPEGFEQ